MKNKILLSLYVSQIGMLVVSSFVMLLLQRRSWLELPFVAEPISWQAFGWAGGLAAVVLIIDAIISSDWHDDGGINELVFARRPLWHIVLICALVAVCEELFFRGMLQYSLGIFWTSMIFTLLHWRYLRRWYVGVYLFLISSGLGWIYLKTGTLWAPIIAHFTIDFVLACFIRWKGGTSN